MIRLINNKMFINKLLLSKFKTINVVLKLELIKRIEYRPIRGGKYIVTSFHSEDKKFKIKYPENRYKGKKSNIDINTNINKYLKNTFVNLFLFLKLSAKSLKYNLDIGAPTREVGAPAILSMKANIPR